MNFPARAAERRAVPLARSGRENRLALRIRAAPDIALPGAAPFGYQQSSRADSSGPYASVAINRSSDPGNCGVAPLILVRVARLAVRRRFSIFSAWRASASVAECRDEVFSDRRP